MIAAAADNRILLPAEMSTWLVALSALVAVAAWVGLRAIRHGVGRIPWLRAAMAVLRVLVGASAIWLAAQVLQRLIVLATVWPIWPIALAAAACVELQLALYARERRTIARRTGTWLVSLRVALTLLVALMLMQPVHTFSLGRDRKPVLAILVDTSASMHVPQTELTPSEKLRLAQMLGVVDRPYRLEDIERDLVAVGRSLAALHDWVQTARRDQAPQVGSRLAARADSAHDTLEEAGKTVDEQATALERVLAGQVELAAETKTTLRNLKTTLNVQLRGRLTDAAKITDTDDPAALDRHADMLQTHLARAVAALAEAPTALRAAAEQIDAAWYAGLDPATRKKVDRAAAGTRYHLADQVLRAERMLPAEDKDDDPEKTSLLKRLSQTYRVKTYAVAARAHAIDPTKPSPRPQTAPADLPAEQQQTDLATALRDVLADLETEPLAGVLLLSDGRHNAPGTVDDLARDLGRRRVPLCAVVLGAERPPRDAAVVEVQPPETVYTGDTVSLPVELKLDGLADEVVKVRLLLGEEQVAEELVRVPRGVDHLRKKIELTTQAKDPGWQEYVVRVETAADKDTPPEVFSGNNEYPFRVSVTRDRTKLLLIETRPRWEFRYIKNLFDGRDPAVQLQYVLLEPDRIEGRPARPRVPASAARPPGQTEATDLPASLAEWLKFDVIILGDVDPVRLGEAGLKALRTFVTDRGGTLVAIAGRHYLPHAYADTPLADLLPVELVAPEGDAPTMVSGDAVFHVAITQDGQDSVLLRSHVDPAENRAIWDAVPNLYWRYPGPARPGAQVLAYALPADPPPFVQRAREGQAAPQDLPLLREFQRRRALISLRHMAPGAVLMFSFDTTWRLRYRVGDTYHHKLWGQVLRWATAAKLPAGTDLVKIGTSRSRYAAREPVRVRARIVREDYTPVVSDQVAVQVLQGKRRVLRRMLQYVPDSPGVYTGSLGVLPGGDYTLELDAPAAADLLRRDGVDQVATTFSVATSAPAEQIELSPDRGLLNRLATLSGGILVEPEQTREILSVLATQQHVDPTPRQMPLWNSWPLLVLIVLLATAEWLLRKKAGLA